MFTKRKEWLSGRETVIERAQHAFNIPEVSRSPAAFALFSTASPLYLQFHV